MLSKCANPGCSAAFLYLNRGKLFRVETVSAKVQAESDVTGYGEKKSERKAEYFWLCEECSRSLTLAYDRSVGITTRRTMKEVAVAAAAS
jgi:ribosomal protein L37AE/L43A